MKEVPLYGTESRWLCKTADPCRQGNPRTPRWPRSGSARHTLSYIRLFALGISSAVLGLVFNDLAMNMSPDVPGVKQLVMLIILLFGHSVNLFMAGLGSFVHPMRLTFVEFYKNAGFEGGGKKYQPYKKRSN